MERTGYGGSIADDACGVQAAGLIGRMKGILWYTIVFSFLMNWIF